MIGTLIFACTAGVLWFAGPRIARRSAAAGRLAQGVLAAMTTVVLVHVATHGVMRAIPGGPFDSEAKLDRQVRAALEAQAREDGGGVLATFERLVTARPVTSLALRDFDSTNILLSGWRRSFALGVRAILIAVGIGVSFGVAAAFAGGRFDRLVKASATLVLSSPVFVWAAILIAIFAFRLGWARPAAIDGASYGLAATAAALPTAAALARLIRDELVGMRDAVFVRAAKTRGASRLRAAALHAFPAALGPAIAFLGPAAASLLTGTLAVEAVFGIPGLGTHMVQSALARDLPVVSAIAAVYAAALGLFAAFSDAAAALVDPKRLEA
jgi:oligopeptide transport system permease protein